MKLDVIVPRLTKTAAVAAVANSVVPGEGRGRQKNPSERDSERKGEQSRVEGAPMSSCWNVVKIVMSYNVRRDAIAIPGQGSGEVWVRGGQRCRKEIALLCSGGQHFFFAVLDAPAHVTFLFETEHRRLRLKTHRNKSAMSQRYVRIKQADETRGALVWSGTCGSLPEDQ